MIQKFIALSRFILKEKYFLQKFQIRYFNPKTRQFYYHAAFPDDSTISPPESASQSPPRNLIVAGEPETFGDYSHPYFAHHMVRNQIMHQNREFKTIFGLTILCSRAILVN